MGILDELIGGGERRQEYDDFVNKVQQGQHDTIPATEAANRYQEVVPSLPTDQYRDSAAQAFSRPEDRPAQLGRAVPLDEERVVALRRPPILAAGGTGLFATSRPASTFRDAAGSTSIAAGPDEERGGRSRMSPSIPTAGQPDVPVSLARRPAGGGPRSRRPDPADVVLSIAAGEDAIRVGVEALDELFALVVEVADDRRSEPSARRGRGRSGRRSRSRSGTSSSPAAARAPARRRRADR
jgi:hypothetical protein